MRASGQLPFEDAGDPVVAVLEVILHGIVVRLVGRGVDLAQPDTLDAVLTEELYVRRLSVLHGRWAPPAIERLEP